MKRYLVFVGETYYPGGGAEDFLTSCETLNEAKVVLEQARIREGLPDDIYYVDRGHVFDCESKKIVFWADWSR